MENKINYKNDWKDAGSDHEDFIPLAKFHHPMLGDLLIEVWNADQSEGKEISIELFQLPPDPTIEGALGCESGDRKTLYEKIVKTKQAMINTINKLMEKY